jgi:hypothetical protein
VLVLEGVGFALGALMVAMSAYLMAVEHIRKAKRPEKG